MSRQSSYEIQELVTLREENRQLLTRLVGADARARDRLRDHIDRLERAIGANKLAIFDWLDVSVDDVYFTPAAYEVLDFKPYSFIPSWSKLVERVHPRQRPRFEREVGRAIYYREPCLLESEMRAADGRYRWIEISAQATRSNPAAPVRLTGSLRDIDEHYRLRGQVAQLSEKLSLVVKASGAGIWDWPDVNIPIVNFSDELVRMLGYDPAQVKITTELYWSLIEPTDHPAVQAAADAALLRSEPFDVEYRLRFLRRGYRWVRSTGVPVKNGRGTVSRLTGSIVDVHERRVAEQQLAAKLASQQRLHDRLATDLFDPIGHIAICVDCIRAEGPADMPPAVQDHLTKILERVAKAEGVLEDLLGGGAAAARPVDT